MTTKNEFAQAFNEVLEEKQLSKEIIRLTKEEPRLCRRADFVRDGRAEILRVQAVKVQHTQSKTLATSGDQLKDHWLMIEWKELPLDIYDAA